MGKALYANYANLYKPHFLGIGTLRKPVQNSFLRDSHSTQTTQTCANLIFKGKALYANYANLYKPHFFRDRHSTQTCANLIFKGKALYANYANQANLIFKGKALYADYANLIFKG